MMMTNILNMNAPNATICFLVVQDTEAFVRNCARISGQRSIHLSEQKRKDATYTVKTTGKVLGSGCLVTFLVFFGMGIICTILLSL